MGATTVDLDIDIKLKNSRIEYLGSKKTHINVNIFIFLSN